MKGRVANKPFHWRRLDQKWMEWQTQFLYEYTWQKSLESLGRSDFKGFVRFIFEHHTALGRHEEMLNERVSKLKMTLPMSEGRWNGFVFVQTPAFRQLSTYPSCHVLDEQESMEKGVLIGTLYIVEELLRRARLATNGDPGEALTFAKSVVSQIEQPHIVEWWNRRENMGVAEILQSLNQGGLVERDQLDGRNLLIWEPSISH